MSEIGLIGKKIGMTREFYKSGQSVPVTVLKLEKARNLAKSLGYKLKIFEAYRPIKAQQKFRYILFPAFGSFPSFC